MGKGWKVLITLVPVVSLFLVTGSTILNAFYPNEYDKSYMILSQLFGFGLFWIPVYYYMWQKYHLCGYTYVAIFGLVFYSVVNLFYILFEIPYDLYAIMFEAVGIGCASFITLMLIIQSLLRNARKYSI